jgi:hypothetical protein
VLTTKLRRDAGAYGPEWRPNRGVDEPQALSDARGNNPRRAKGQG